MTLELTWNGLKDRLELLSPAPSCRFRIGDGAERDAHVEVPEPGVYSILMDGRVYDAHVEEGADGVVVVIDGHRFEIDVRDPRRLPRQSGRKAADGVQTVVAPMPGKVVRVLVAAGDTVEAGQGLVVVEAMKMQNEMKAPRTGRVLAVPAREGGTVAAGDVLATLE
jgi:acetyl/propionyl-CoA carboxylase alpha subunit